MKKKMGKVFRIVLLVSFIFITATVLALPAFAADTSCATKYPIIMAHGMGFIATPVYPNSFPGIGEALTAKGAKVYFTNVDSLASTRQKAEQFKAQFLQIKAATGAAKFNIIGHSHGGLYTRDAITNLGLYPYVASLTTVDSPHRGSKIAQTMVDIKRLVPALAEMMAGMVPFAGDQSQLDINILNLSEDYMNRVFNPNTPNKSGIYYQSWTGAFRDYNIFSMLSYFLNMLMQSLGGTLEQPSTPQQYVAAFHKALPALATEMWLLFAGFNDGLVTDDSAKWGYFRGTEFGSWWSHGVDHLDMVNLNSNGVSFDVVGGYVNIVKGLKSKGY
jgi:triacylglycerol lipase